MDLQYIVHHDCRSRDRVRCLADRLRPLLRHLRQCCTAALFCGIFALLRSIEGSHDPALEVLRSKSIAGETATGVKISVLFLARGLRPAVTGLVDGELDLVYVLMQERLALLVRLPANPHVEAPVPAAEATGKVVVRGFPGTSRQCRLVYKVTEVCYGVDGACPRLSRQMKRTPRP